MNNFGHIEAMKVIFFWKCSKCYVDFENVIKLREKFDGFEGNCVDFFAKVSVNYDKNICDGWSTC